MMSDLNVQRDVGPSISPVARPTKTPNCQFSMAKACVKTLLQTGALTGFALAAFVAEVVDAACL